MNEKISLSELNNTIKKVIGDGFKAPIWVTGEIAEINVNASGHCYLMLVEKEATGDKIVAQARATIWSYTFRMLRPFFETTTGQQLKDGIKVMLQVSVEFHELYGFSLNVRNIDPTYTLGDLARRRREIIQRLTDEGVITMNKELELPLVPQRIAIISSPTAAGYEDFMEQLRGNAQSFIFHTCLFPAIMQGNQAEQSMVDALERIFPYAEFFDVVVIIRGGGSQVDLSCFDNYNIAYHVTQFPLPVITGIGHEKDDSIVDFVAHTRMKTPTAVAEFLINGLNTFEQRLNELEQQTLDLVEDRLSDEQERLEMACSQLSQLVRKSVENKKQELLRLSWHTRQEIRMAIKMKSHQLDSKVQQVGFQTQRLIFSQTQQLETFQGLMKKGLSTLLETRERYLDGAIHTFRRLTENYLRIERHKLEIAGQKGQMSDPVNLLRKGYTFTTMHGKLVKDLTMVQKDEVIQTHFQDGSISSRITEINKSDKYVR